VVKSILQVVRDMCSILASHILTAAL